jgi:ectoine hydroxylase-related dioxygenase (phytanoyl-CoA dioxygenase family)
MRELNRFSPEVTTERVVEALEEDGYAIIENLLDPPRLRALNDELAPHIAARAPGTDEMMGTKTRRFGGLLWRSPSVQDLVLQPQILSAADALLLPYCVRYQLNYTGVMYLEPGETSQPLHRDTGFYPFQNPAPPLLLASMWALSDFTAQNGATRLVPGSRHWDDAREPLPEEIVAAEMPAGSVLLYVGGTFHGGGANCADRARFGLALHYSLGWLRQEENQYLSVPTEVARSLPKEIQQLMGYSLGASALGFVDHQDPLEFLNGAAGTESGDIYGGILEADQALHRFDVSGTAVSGRHYFDLPPNDPDPGELDRNGTATAKKGSS